MLVFHILSALTSLFQAFSCNSSHIITPLKTGNFRELETTTYQTPIQAQNTNSKKTIALKNDDYLNVMTIAKSIGTLKNTLDFPFLAIVKWDLNVTLCLGSVISHWHVITAASCLIRDNGLEREANRLSVSLGTSSRNASSLSFKAKRYFVPTEYVRNLNLNNIAIIELDMFVEFSTFVHLVPLSVMDDAFKPVAEEHEICITFGWLDTESRGSKLQLDDSEEDVSSFLHYSLEILTFHETCADLVRKTNLFKRELSDFEVCTQFAGYRRPNLFSHGAPLICKSQHLSMLVGITSACSANNESSPFTVYTRTDIYFDYITAMMVNRSYAVLEDQDMTLAGPVNCPFHLALYLIYSYLFSVY